MSFWCPVLLCTLVCLTHASLQSQTRSCALSEATGLFLRALWGERLSHLTAVVCTAEVLIVTCALDQHLLVAQAICTIHKQASEHRFQYLCAPWK